MLEMLHQWARTGTVAVPLPFDVVNEEKITHEAWIDLPDGGQTRQLLENIFPVGCGGNGSARGNALSGKEVMNSNDDSSLTSETLDQLRDIGVDASALADLFSGPLVIIMGSDTGAGFPPITAADECGSLSLNHSQVYGTQDAG